MNRTNHRKSLIARSVSSALAMMATIAAGAASAQMASAIDGSQQVAPASPMLLAQATGAPASSPMTKGEAADADQIQSVVVTARRRAERIQDVPLSITAVSGDELRDRGAVRIADIPIANISFVGPENNAVPNFSVRGVQSQNRPNVGFDSGIGVYVDGVYMGRGAGFNQESFDIERVEFLRGPQGTLFGKNSIAGAISVTTKQPGTTPEATISADLGSNNQRRFSGYVSSPVGDDTIRASLSGYSGKRDGYINNIATGTKVGTEDVTAVRGKILFTPNARLNITLAADSLDDKSIGTMGKILSGYGFVPGADDFTSNTNLLPTAYRKLQGIGATVNYDLGPNLRLTSITSNRKVSTDRNNDPDFGPLAIADSHKWYDQKQWSQELRISSIARSTFEYVAGMYYYNQKVNSNAQTCWGPTAPGIPSIRNLCGNTFGDIETTTTAAFGNLDWNISSVLTFTGGLRSTKEDKALSYQQKVQWPAFISPALALETDTVSTSNITPLISARWKVTPKSMVYGTVSKGFRSGGWNVDNITVGGPSTFRQTRFGDESLVNYELGTKNTLMNGKLDVNLTLFRMDYTDIQVTQLVPALGGGGALLGVVTNGGEARSQGAEIEIAARPMSGLKVSAGLGFVDAKYTDYVDKSGTTPLSFSGKYLNYAPRTTANLSASYTFPIKGGTLTLLGDYRNTDSYYTGRENLPTQKIPSYDIFNARIAYATDNDHVEVAIYSNNLFDKRYIVAQGPGGFAAPVGVGANQTVEYGRGRTIGLTGTYRF